MIDYRPYKGKCPVWQTEGPTRLLDKPNAVPGSPSPLLSTTLAFSPPSRPIVDFHSNRLPYLTFLFSLWGFGFGYFPPHSTQFTSFSLLNINKNRRKLWTLVTSVPNIGVRPLGGPLFNCHRLHSASFTCENDHRRLLFLYNINIRYKFHETLPT